MAQPKPERVSLDQVLRLIAQLAPEEQDTLRRRLGLKDWGDEWRRLENEIETASRARRLPDLTEEEIFEEVTATRREQREDRAQGSN